MAYSHLLYAILCALAADCSMERRHGCAFFPITGRSLPSLNIAWLADAHTCMGWHAGMGTAMLRGG